MTLAVAAKQIGIPTSHLSRLELEQMIPSARTLARLSTWVAGLTGGGEVAHERTATPKVSKPMKRALFAAAACFMLTSGAWAQTTATVPPIPGATNRPVIAGETLSWSGPVGGGPSNGVYSHQSRVLTVSGPVTTSSDGQIIEGLDIRGTGGLTNGVLTIKNNGVIIREDRIFETTAGQQNKYTVFVDASVTVAPIIEDTLIDGHALNGGGNTSCVSGDVGNKAGGPGVRQIIMRRDTCERSEQALRYVLGSATPMPGDTYAIRFTENWCHLMGGQDADWVEIYPAGTTNEVNNILVQYNLFDGTNNKAGGSDSGVNLTTASGLPAGTIGPNILIDHNWFIHWNTVHFIVASGSGGGSISFGFTNNGILKGFLDNASPADGVKANGGNYIMSTPTSLTGALYHGTGNL